MKKVNDKPKYTILIADDNPNNLSILEEMLEKNGYKVRSATNGLQVIESIKIAVPDLILLDVHMPKMDGYEACEIIKADPNLKDITVLFISALNDAFNIVKGFQVGGQDYITKPFNLEEVLARVKTHLELKEKTIQLTNALERLKEKELELVQIEKMKSYHLIISGISHEFNNPINYIKSSTDALKQNYEELFKIIEYCSQNGLEQIKSDFSKEFKTLIEKIDMEIISKETPELFENITIGIKKLKEIIQTLKSFSKINESTMMKVNLNDEIDSVIQFFKHQLPEHVVLQKKYSEPVKMTCYPSKFKQLLLNLLTNSLESIIEKNSHTQNEIKIETRIHHEKKSGFIEIIITDTGKGINDKDKDKIFDPFFTTKEFGRYPGLGLTLSLHIVQELNGNIVYEPNSTNGSKFRITIPVN